MTDALFLVLRRLRRTSLCCIGGSCDTNRRLHCWSDFLHVVQGRIQFTDILSDVIFSLFTIQSEPIQYPIRLFCLISFIMFSGLGIGWACTLLGFTAVILSPIPWVFTHRGPKLRSKTKYATLVVAESPKPLIASTAASTPATTMTERAGELPQPFHSGA